MQHQRLDDRLDGTELRQHNPRDKRDEIFNRGTEPGPLDDVRETLGAAGRVADDRQGAVVARDADRLGNPRRHRLVAARVPLRRPGGSAAERLDALRDQNAHPGALEETLERARDADSGALRPEHAVDAGWQVDGDGVVVPGSQRSGEWSPGAPACGQVVGVLRQHVGAHEGATHVRGAGHEWRWQCIRDGQRHRTGTRYRPPGLRRELPASRQNRVLALAAQALHELTGVDEHRAGRHAHAVDGAGVDAGVVVVALELGEQLAAAVSLSARHGATRDDALPRRERQVLAWAHRLAVPTLDAAVGLNLDGLGVLEVFEVGVRVVVDDDPRVQHASRVAQPLQLHHDVVNLVTVLAANIGCHDAPGAVLGLEVAVRAKHKLDHVFREVDVAPKRLVAFEAVSEHEVDVAVLRVPEDDAVAVVVFREEVLQGVAGWCQRRHRHNDVLEQRRRARRAGPGDRGVEPLAELPRGGPLHRVC